MFDSDTVQAVIDEVRGVDWRLLDGAYGACDGSNHYRDISQMFYLLATCIDPDSDAWGGAYDDALLAQVWHQYSLYSVTPQAVGFVVRLARLRLADAPNCAKDLAVAVQLIAEAAHHRRLAADGAERALGDRTAAELVRHRSVLEALLTTPLTAYARRVGEFVPELNLA